MQRPSTMEGTLSRTVANAQALASGAGSLVHGSALAVSKIPRDGLGDNTLGAVGWAQYVWTARQNNCTRWEHRTAQQASEELC